MKEKKRMIDIVKADYDIPSHHQAIAALIMAYVGDPMGNGTIDSLFQSDKLLSDLKKQSNGLVLLAKLQEQYVGILVAFKNYSTFLVKGMINIHDLFVLPEYRNLGIGNALIEEIIKEASLTDCGKITLEVREDNFAAMKLYQKMGFDACKPMMLFRVRLLQ